MKFVKKNIVWISLVAIIVLALAVRLICINSVPPSLYWDEVSQGYNAYSILTTGYDEHGEFLPLARFIAFGDYKAPVYTYTIVPFMAIFGKSTIAVRLPSVIFGTLTVLFLFLLAKELIAGKRGIVIGLLSGLFLAISPWHIQLSRAAYEGNVAVFFTVAAVYVFLVALRKKSWLLPLSSVLFVAAFYSFNVQKVFIPLFLAALGIIYFKKLWKMKGITLISIAVALFLLIPYIQFFNSPESKLRFNEVNIFSDLSIIEESNELQAYAGNTPLAKVIYNRRVLFAREYIENYFDFYNMNFLFFTGDGNPRFSHQNNGQLYLWMLPLILIGVYATLKERNKSTLVIFSWLLLAPVAGATARETPHALRGELMLPMLAIIAALGTYTLICSLKKWKTIHKLSYVILGLCVLFSLSTFLYNYFVHFPRVYSGEWQYGYEQAIKSVMEKEASYDKVLITNAYGRPYIYLLFYSQITPEEYKDVGVTEKDQFGLYNVNKIGKFEFVDSVPSNEAGKTLIVMPKEKVPQNYKPIDEIKFLNGKTAFVIAEQE